MEIQTAIAILETKKLSCCHQKDFLQAVDMAISASGSRIPKPTNTAVRRP